MSAEPPTRIQGRTNSATFADPPTRLQQPAGRSRPVDARHGSELPAALTEKYQFERLLGTGTEGAVWLAHPSHDDDQPPNVAVKIYWPDIEVDTGLRSRLDDPRFHRHLPRLHGHGQTAGADGRTVAWEAMEYFPRGSLRDLMTAEAAPGGGLAPKRVRDLLAELGRAVTFWEEVVHARQMDLSPGNILIRADVATDLQLVISDFGGVVGTGPSQRVGDMLGKAAYVAPEALSRTRDTKSPWWSVGIIVHEMLTGRGPWGDDKVNETLDFLLATADPELVDLPDDRWALLVGGLLTRNTAHRWSGPEVVSWLAGRSPAVHRSTSVATATIPPITYRDEDYRAPAELAAQPADDGDTAAEWLVDGGAIRLLRWLTNDVKDTRLDRSVLRFIADDLMQGRYAVAVLAATFAPERTTPRYGGRPVDEAGLAALAASSRNSDLLRELFQTGALTQAARHHCTHPGCGNKCAVLSRVATEVPRVVKAITEDWAALRDEIGTEASVRLAFPLLGKGGTLLSPEELDRAYRDAVTMTLRPVSPTIPKVLRVSTPAAGWWTRRRQAAMAATPTTLDGRAALISTALLAPHAETYLQALSAERAAEQRRQREVARNQARRRKTARALRVRPWWAFLWIVLSIVGALDAFGGWVAANPQVVMPEVWPEVLKFVASEILPPVQDFVVGKPLPDPLTQWVMPESAGALDWWMIVPFPVVFLIAWRLGRRPSPSTQWVAPAVAVTVAPLFVLHVYANSGVHAIIAGALVGQWAAALIGGLFVAAIVIGVIVAVMAGS